MDLENAEEMFHPVLETEDYTFKVMKMTDSKYTIHMDVHKWTKETFTGMLEAWPEVLNAFHEQGIEALYAVVPSEREHSAKFAAMFGLSPQKSYDVEFEDGHIETFEVYKTLTSPEEYV